MGPDEVEFVEMFVMASEFGVLPVAGGWLDQPAAFVAMFREFKQVLAELPCRK